MAVFLYILYTFVTGKTTNKIHGKPVIMGRKTFESLGKPLPGRLNVVLSQQGDLVLPPGVIHCQQLQEALEKAEKENTDEAFIIGGGKIFELAMPDADRIYLTRVHTHIDNAHAFFPAIDHTHWKLISEKAHGADEKHKFAYTFQKYERTEL